MKTTGLKEAARVLSQLFTLSLLENILSHICGWIIKSVCVFSTLFQTHLNILAYSQYLQGTAEPVWDVKENGKAYIQKNLSLVRATQLDQADGINEIFLTQLPWSMLCYKL